jgi:hypothetical protein
MTDKAKTFESQYYDPDRYNLRVRAVTFAKGVIADFENDEITPDSGYVYGVGRQHAETFMLAGNGPTAHAVFLFDNGEVDTGYIEYTESTGEIVRLPDWIAADLYAALVASS